METTQTGIVHSHTDITHVDSVTEVTDEDVIRSVLSGAQDFCLSADAMVRGYHADVDFDRTWLTVIAVTEGATLSDAVLAFESF